MKCKVCNKKLRSHNKIGTCRIHRNVSDARKLYMSKYAETNHSRLSEYKKNWANLNKEKLRSQYYRRLENIHSALSHALRNRLNRALKRNTKSGSAVRDCGCTMEELKLHIEKQFKSGMTWDNWSRDGWHIDHIIPLSTVDIADRAQFLTVAHYTNLRPLWWYENLGRRKDGSQEWLAPAMLGENVR